MSSAAVSSHTQSTMDMVHIVICQRILTPKSNFSLLVSQNFNVILMITLSSNDRKELFYFPWVLIKENKFFDFFFSFMCSVNMLHKVGYILRAVRASMTSFVYTIRFLFFPSHVVEHLRIFFTNTFRWLMSYILSSSDWMNLEIEGNVSVSEQSLFQDENFRKRRITAAFDIWNWMSFMISMYCFLVHLSFRTGGLEVLSVWIRSDNVFLTRKIFRTTWVAVTSVE